MKKIAVNFRPAVFIAGGLIFGILLTYFFVFNNVFAAVFTAVLCALFLISFVRFSSVKFKIRGQILCVLVFFAVAATGSFGFLNTLKKYDGANLGGHTLTVTAKIAEITPTDGGSCVVLTDVVLEGAVSGKSAYKIVAEISGDGEYRIGDVIKFSKAMTDRSAFYNGRFFASSVAEGIKYGVTLDCSEVEITGSFPDFFKRCELFIFDTLKAGMDEDTFPVAYAMLTGNSDYIAEEVLTAYRFAGVAHIFAVSGLHVGILATAVFYLLRKLKVNAAVSFCISVVLCFMYCGICGFSASSVRALVMFFTLNFAKIAGLKYDGVSAVFAAAAVTLLFSPVQLFCAGFQLSFFVVATIIILHNPLSRALKFLPEKIRLAVGTALSAEIGGIPVMLYAFGNFPTLSTIVNVLFVPIVGAIFIGLIVCVILGGIFSPAVFLLVPNYVILGINAAFTLFDFRIFLLGGFTLGIFSVCYYGTVVLCGNLLNVRGKLKTILCLLLAAVCVTGTCVKTVCDKYGFYAEIIGSEKLSAVALVGKNDNLMIISDASRAFPFLSLKRAAASLSGKVTVVFLNADYGADIQVMTTRLMNCLDVGHVFYCGAEDETAEYVTEQSLGVSVAHLSGGDSLPFAGGSGVLYADGRCVYITAGGADIAIFSALKEDGAYVLPDISPRTVIGYDTLFGIKTKYSPASVFSFRANGGYKNGETCGNLTVRI